MRVFLSLGIDTVPNTACFDNVSLVDAAPTAVGLSDVNPTDGKTRTASLFNRVDSNKSP